jgi:hypothetical protein
MPSETPPAEPKPNPAPPPLRVCISDVRRAVMIRAPGSMLIRIDRAAKRLGLSRAAFMLSSTIERLERMERE